MVLPHGSGDLYHKYRPKKFSEVAGNKQVVSSIKKAMLAAEPSQSYLLFGDSGTGKTTTARIMALVLNCPHTTEDYEPCLECSNCKSIISGKCSDVIEVNAADNRGINDIRALCKTMPLMPMQLERKVLILDEAHQLTNEAQSSLLKELEEAPKHVFIILCSTHPQKLLPTVKNRCQKFKFSSLARMDMIKLLEEVATLEAEDLPKRVYEVIADASSGSPRSGLVLLQQVIQMESRELTDILKLIEGEDSDDGNVIQLCLALDKNPKWGNIVELYESCKHLGPPAIGMVIGGFYRNQLLKATSNIMRADVCSKILDLFAEPFADGKLGENQLILNLYKSFKVISGGSNGPARYGQNSNRP